MPLEEVCATGEVFHHPQMAENTFSPRSQTSSSALAWILVHIMGTFLAHRESIHTDSRPNAPYFKVGGQNGGVSPPSKRDITKQQGQQEARSP